MTSPTQPGPDAQALMDALAAEHAAVFAYGIVAAFSNPARSDQVAVDAAAHRARRDATIDALTRAGFDAPPAEAGYSVPFPVIDPISAAQLAAQVETDTATAWLSVIERGDSDQTRDFGVQALTEASIRAALWRSVLGVAPPTVPFPGRP